MNNGRKKGIIKTPQRAPVRRMPKEKTVEQPEPAPSIFVPERVKEPVIVR